MRKQINFKILFFLDILKDHKIIKQKNLIFKNNVIYIF